jgi:hypothetical protein
MQRRDFIKLEETQGFPRVFQATSIVVGVLFLAYSELEVESIILV